MTTHFDEKQWNIVEDVAKSQGISKYKLLKDAVMAYCVACVEKEKKLDEQRRNTSGESPETSRETVRTASGDTKSTPESKFSLPEAADYADPPDIGL
jgi:hypothetical protein